MTAGFYSLQAIVVDSWSYDEWLPEWTLKIIVKNAYIYYQKWKNNNAVFYFIKHNLFSLSLLEKLVTISR